MASGMDGTANKALNLRWAVSLSWLSRICATIWSFVSGVASFTPSAFLLP